MHAQLHLSFWFLLLAACTTGAEVVRDARPVLIGMNSDDLQACAGIPNRTKRLNDRTELFSYEEKNENVGGMQVTLPLVGGFKLAGSGSYCQAIFRIVDGRVAGLHFTGDNDDILGKEGVCAPIVRGCLRDPGPGAVQGVTAAAQTDVHIAAMRRRHPGCSIPSCNGTSLS
jgi:hypothetical protein